MFPIDGVGNSFPMKT